ncbi:hypothetical protein E6C76_10025 [Pseudothauera nasutitermitis]|uniref:Uncharacterized protein n=1 Tax=Pseudothauera nasutitermitis TaxID=2565930 RepID=A0A4S4B0I3_9RHOO|nr:hypothetical protein [Pseudothauera nasutitermitis]THF65866.1 hypothetical protein E6C76_10025 [Pseudothauera nasutitermitis]
MPVCVVATLQAAGFRATRVQTRVFSLVAASPVPIAADDIIRLLFAEGASTSSSSAHRTLHELTLAGLLLREWVPGRTGARAVYSIHADRTVGCRTAAGEGAGEGRTESCPPGTSCRMARAGRGGVCTSP